MTTAKNQSERDVDHSASGRDGGGASLDPQPVDLRASIEPFEITPDMVVATLFASAHDAIELPAEMKGTVERIWRDETFTWPTTVCVSRVTLSTEDAEGEEPPQHVWSRVSILGTGWAADRPVSLRWGNAFGFENATAELPEVTTTPAGFFGVDLILRTTPRKHAEYVWESSQQLILVAQQTDDDNNVVRFTEQRSLPPHLLWQWVR